MGFVSFRCGPGFSVQPFFDSRGAQAEVAVTIHAEKIVRRNFTTRVIGHNRSQPIRETAYSSEPVTALPFGHYGKVTFAVRTVTEARALTATVTAVFAAGISKHKGYPPLGACYVKKWLVSMTVSPF